MDRNRKMLKMIEKNNSWRLILAMIRIAIYGITGIAVNLYILMKAASGDRGMGDALALWILASILAVIGIERKEKIFESCSLVFLGLLVFMPILDAILKENVALLAGITAVTGVFVSIAGALSCSRFVLKTVIGKEAKCLFSEPGEKFDDLLKKLKKEINEEGILKKDHDEALYLRMKYFFENEAPQIIIQRKEEAARNEELHRRELEEGRKKMQKFSDKYSGNLELEKKR